MRAIAASLFVLSVGSMLGGCYSATAHHVPERAPGKRPAAVLPRQAHAPATIAYLRLIHQQLTTSWQQGVLQPAAQLLPADDPANDVTLMAAVEIRLDPRGQPLLFRLTQRSGYHRFDNSALRVMRGAQHWPRLPAVYHEAQVSIIWRFFRDPARACHFRFALVRKEPLPRQRQLYRAIVQARYDEAGQILGSAHPINNALLEMVAQAGIASADKAAQTLAVRLAPAWLRAALLESKSTTPALWDAALDEVVRCRNKEVLVSLLARLARRQGWPAHLTAAQQREASRRTAHLFRAGRRFQLAIPAAVVDQALLSRDAPLMAQAAALSSNRPLLRRAARTLEHQPELAITLATRLVQLGPEPASEQLLKSALHDPARRRWVLEALVRYPLPALAAEVTALLTQVALPEADVLAAMQVARAISENPIPLLKLLRHKNPTIQLAAIRSLGHLSQASLGVCYRLGDLAYKESGAVRAAAVEALAHIGHERFRRDVLLLVRRLSAVEQARVVPYLVHFGPPALGAFRRMMELDDQQLLRALQRALARLNNPGAAELQQHVLAKLRPSGQQHARSESTLPGKMHLPPIQSLEHLLQYALALADTRAAR